MQSKLLLTALLVSVASSAANAQNSTESGSFTVLPKLNSEQLSRVGNTLAEFGASHTTDADFTAIDGYLSSAPTAYQSEFNSELVDFDVQLITTKAVKIPPFVTKLPSSLQGYMISYLEGESKIIVAADLVTSTTVELRRQTVRSISTATDTRSSPSSTGTQTGATSSASGTKSNPSSSASGSSTTAAPSLAQSATSTTAKSSSSSTGNAATQPTGALKAMGALAVGVIGLVVMA